MTEMTIAPDETLARVTRLQANIERVIRGKSEVIQLAVAALLARGHILLEDVPGVGKTTLAHALASSVSLSFQRIQFTSDLLPSDIIGVTIFNQERGEFEFISGPVFTNVLLADEINRATPKSQSALLEAMSEGMLTVEKNRIRLPNPFLVIATQNPVEHAGTYPLPESQLDRFMMKLTLGYPNPVDEKKLLRSGGAQEALDHLEPVLTGDELLALQAGVANVHVEEALADYLMAIVLATRSHPEISLGVSTRGSLTYFRAAQALAIVRGRDFVLPDDIKQLAEPVLSHRIMLRDRGIYRSEFTPEARLVRQIVASIPVPR